MHAHQAGIHEIATVTEDRTGTQALTRQSTTAQPPDDDPSQRLKSQSVAATTAVRVAEAMLIANRRHTMTHTPPMRHGLDVALAPPLLPRALTRDDQSRLRIEPSKTGSVTCLRNGKRQRRLPSKLVSWQVLAPVMSQVTSLVPRAVGLSALPWVLRR